MVLRRPSTDLAGAAGAVLVGVEQVVPAGGTRVEGRLGEGI